MKIPALVRIVTLRARSARGVTARPRVFSFHGHRSKRLVTDLHNVKEIVCFYHLYK
jgi:hypothetical protein